MFLLSLIPHILFVVALQQQSSSLSSSLPASSTSAFASSTSVSVSISSSSSASTASTSVASSSSVTPSISSALPSETPVADEDLDTIRTLRIAKVVVAAGSASKIGEWLETNDAEGAWPNVDYTTGCPARRANWPAQSHWRQILSLAAAYHGGLDGAEQYVGDPAVAEVVSRAIDWWFTRDMPTDQCLDRGGLAECPCGTTGMWNTNWFSNIILIPNLVAQTCLLFDTNLTDAQRSKCISMTQRSYAQFDRNISGVGQLTGANTLDVARVGADLGIFTSNSTLLLEAYGRVHGEMVIQNKLFGDGVRPDGSFGQHAGMLYTGNYGKDYSLRIIDFENDAASTRFSAPEPAQGVFETLLGGTKWMVFRNTDSERGTLHYDFSVVGRMISFPVADNQATGQIHVNLTAIRELGQKWDSDELQSFSNSLSQPSETANAGGLVGNKMFYTNDYMVHRGENYVTTLKMYSSRTTNTECVNSQNTKGFHLSDGTLYTYLAGSEYTDIAAAWDWRKIPGTTSTSDTVLDCGTTSRVGKEAFVGGVSDGKQGLAVMRYTSPKATPTNEILKWQKAWFFLDNDVQLVMLSNLTSTSGGVVSVLDQRRKRGSVVVNVGGASVTQKEKVATLSGISTLWHGDVGYVFDPATPLPLTIDTGIKTGNWSAIGTSAEPPVIVDLFSAYFTHPPPNNSTAATNSLSYTILPGTTQDEFESKSRTLSTKIKSIVNDGSVAAVYDRSTLTAYSVFWKSSGGSVDIPLLSSEFQAATGRVASPALPEEFLRLQITSTANIALIYDLMKQRATVSDPSQSLASADVTFRFGATVGPVDLEVKKTVKFEFPPGPGGLAGSSVSKRVF